mgnify:CR=1 FL=1
MAQITKRAQKKKERLIILRKNVPIFELRPLSKKEATLESLSMSIERGLADVKAGRTYTHEEVKKFFGIK